MGLLERKGALSQFSNLLSMAGQGASKLVLVRGEAGIGKTAVVSAFVESVQDSAHVLWGGCDDLLAATPLGPLWDMADTEPTLRASLEANDRLGVFREVLSLMSRGLRPTAMVIEDVQWADDATLDLIKYLGRRLDRTHGLLILTYRDEEVFGDHPLRRVLGDVPHDIMVRIVLEPLTSDAIAAIVGPEIADLVRELTGGNPFFVSEIGSSHGEAIPVSISESVTARLLRLSPAARRIAELLSVIPGGADLDLLEKSIGPDVGALGECEEAGLLLTSGQAAAFRHELVRRAIESSLTPARRRELNLEVLAASESAGADLARCAHHARESGDGGAMIRLLPAAARRAAQLESHREAVAHLRALEPFLDRMSDEEQADCLDLWAWEEYLANPGSDTGIEERALSKRRELGDPSALGNTLLMASRISWQQSRRAKAVEYAEEAVRLLEGAGGEALGMAYSTVAHLATLANEEARAVEFGEKALAVAGEKPNRTMVHALCNLGAVKCLNHHPHGLDQLEESFRLAADLGLHYDQARAAVNLAWSALYIRDLEQSRRWLEAGLAVAEDYELHPLRQNLLATEVYRLSLAGEWDQCSALAIDVLTGAQSTEVSRMVVAHSLAQVATRRGSADAEHRALEAWEQAKRMGEWSRMIPPAAVLAEYSWLGGDLSTDIKEELAMLVHLPGGHWFKAELAMWLHVGGVIDSLPDETPAPFMFMTPDGWGPAAVYWEEMGCPYERALALTFGDDQAKLTALEILYHLGAAPLASRLRAQLRDRGLRGVPRGPQRARRESPLGLTSRQTDVLLLLAEELSNAEIADRLFLSPRTVDHHVSAILGTLGAANRAAAVKLARQASFIP